MKPARKPSGGSLSPMTLCRSFSLERTGEGLDLELDAEPSATTIPVF